jgi:WD40 repeat protein
LNDRVKRYEVALLCTDCGKGDEEIPYNEPLFQEEIRAEIIGGLFSPLSLSFSSVAYSSDGKIVAALDSRGVLWLKHIETDEITKLDKYDCRGFRFSPDGKRLALLDGNIFRDGNMFRILDVATWREIVAYQGYGDSSYRSFGHWNASLAFSPSGKSIATVGRQGIVRIWNPETGEDIRIIDTKTESNISSLTFSEDGNILASSHSGIYHVFFTDDEPSKAKFWEPTTGKELGELELFLHKGYFAHQHLILFSPRGEILAVNKRAHVELWDISIEQNPQQKTDLQVIGRLSDCFLFRSIRAINIGHLSFSPGGKTIAASNGNEIVIWDMGKSKRVRFFHRRDGGNEKINDLAFSPDGLTLAAATSTGVYLIPLSPAD